MQISNNGTPKIHHSAEDPIATEVKKSTSNTSEFDPNLLTITTKSSPQQGSAAADNVPPPHPDDTRPDNVEAAQNSVGKLTEDNVASFDDSALALAWARLEIISAQSEKNTLAARRDARQKATQSQIENKKDAATSKLVAGTVQSSAGIAGGAAALGTSAKAFDSNVTAANETRIGNNEIAAGKADIKTSDAGLGNTHPTDNSITADQKLASTTSGNAHIEKASLAAANAQKFQDYAQSFPAIINGVGGIGSATATFISDKQEIEATKDGMEAGVAENAMQTSQTAIDRSNARLDKAINAAEDFVNSAKQVRHTLIQY